MTGWAELYRTGSRDVPVLGSHVHVVDTGVPSGQDPAETPTVVVLHGNPTSSYLWRHVVAALASTTRCVALDLIGMGRSGKPAIGYEFADHRRYLAAALAALDLPPYRLLLHDWGVALGIDHLRRNPARVVGVAMMEGHLLPIDSWSDLDPVGRAMFAELRTPDVGRRRIETENVFVEQVLPAGMHHRLSAAEHDAYRHPFPTPDSRYPIWRWITQIPIAGEPAAVRQVLLDNLATLATTAVPRLLLYADPGAVLDAGMVDRVQALVPGLQTADVGPGLHFLPEDQPGRIADLVRAWLGS